MIPQESHSLKNLALPHPSTAGLGIPQHKATLHCLDGGGDVPVKKGMQRYLCAAENRAEKETGQIQKWLVTDLGERRVFIVSYWPGWHPLPSSSGIGTQNGIKSSFQAVLVKASRFKNLSEFPACKDQGGKLSLIWRECWSGRKLYAPEERLDAQLEVRQILFSQGQSPAPTQPPTVPRAAWS